MRPPWPINMGPVQDLMAQVDLIFLEHDVRFSPVYEHPGLLGEGFHDRLDSGLRCMHDWELIHLD